MASYSFSGPSMAGVTMEAWKPDIVHPQPKKITLYNVTTFGGDVSNKPALEYSPADPIDFMRFRLGRTWIKEVNSNAGSLRQDPPIVPGTPPQPNTKGYVQEPKNNLSIGFNLREKIVIEPTQEAITAAGNIPTPPALETPTLSVKNKWLKALDSSIVTNPSNVDPHQIISTFSRLQEIEGDPNTSISFEDHVFQYDAPLSTKEIGDNYYGSLNVMAAQIKPVYNFYVQSYESILTRDQSEPTPPESILPSLYSFLSVIQNDDNKITQDASGQTVTDTIFERHITLEGTIQGTRIEQQVMNNSGQQVLTEISKGQYFDKYSYAFAEQAKEAIPVWYQVPNSQGRASSLAGRFRNQILPTSNLELFSTPNDAVNRFPMYCDITFSTDSRNNKMLTILEEAKMTTMLMKDFVDGNFTANSEMSFNFLSSDGLPFRPANYQETPYKFDTEAPSQLIPSGTLECWDVLGWANGLTARNIDNIYGQTTQGVFLGKFDEEVMMAGASALERSLMSMSRAMSQTVFMAKFNDLVTNETRTWNELDSEKAYHETIFYKVEKWESSVDGAPVGREPLQNFYFPNSTTLQEHKFTDTQVKYGKRYIYRIFAYEMVFGTKYKYQMDASPAFESQNLVQNYNIRENQARVCIISEPSVKLIKVPYYSKQLIMMDSPPVWPDVDVIPYRGVEDKLLFWLKGNVGNYDLNPIAILPSDQEEISSIRLAQDKTPNELVNFKSDDQANKFEVFRLTTKPTRYSDFIGAKIAEIDSSANLGEACKSSTSGEWVDNIVPNQRYYYLFRTIDNHNHFSNPSPIYEVEMVHDGYAPFLVRDVYFLEDSLQAPQTPTKNFAKYLYIKPAFSQRSINEVNSGLKNEQGEKLCDSADCLTAKGPKGDWIQLGTTNQALWGKKMKVRVISRKTGKRVDINIKFNTKHEELNVQNNTNNNLC